VRRFTNRSSSVQYICSPCVSSLTSLATEKPCSHAELPQYRIYIICTCTVLYLFLLLRKVTFYSVSMSFLCIENGRVGRLSASLPFRYHYPYRVTELRVISKESKLPHLDWIILTHPTFHAKEHDSVPRIRNPIKVVCSTHYCYLLFMPLFETLILFKGLERFRDSPCSESMG
jgi:hypothetical protein